MGTTEVRPAVRWSAERRALFLETLALTSNVAASERAAQMPASSAYKQRARDAEFRAAWAQALREGYDRLEIALLERAIKGQRRNLRNKEGKLVGYDTEFSERLALSLLNAHRQSVRGEEARPAESAEEFRKRLARRIAAIRKARDDD